MNTVVMSRNRVQKDLENIGDEGTVGEAVMYFGDGPMETHHFAEVAALGLTSYYTITNVQTTSNGNMYDIADAGGEVKEKVPGWALFYLTGFLWIVSAYVAAAEAEIVRLRHHKDLLQTILVGQQHIVVTSEALQELLRLKK